MMKSLLSKGVFFKISSLIKQYLGPSVTAAVSQPKSFTDEFTDIIQQIKERKLKVRNPPQVTYKPRYAYTGRIRKNKWKAIDPADVFEENEQKDFVRKVKHCMVLGFSGANYTGMQRQRDLSQNTVEEELLKAMLKNDWITKEAFRFPYKMEFQRASRTDKGVSAARQCCSLLLPANLDIETLNKDLPEDIRVFGLKRVTRTFDAKNACYSRTYSYTLPTIAFCHYTDQISMRDYRITSDKLKQVNEILQNYKGAKKYHNFTIKKEFFDPSSIRQMFFLECSEPFLANDVEFAVIRIRGASFMMHQIRKMVGLMLAVARGVTDESVFERVFDDNIIDIPTAPGLGLVLDQVHYDKYDRTFGVYGKHEKLTWEECEEAVQRFRENFIHSTIVRTEIEEESMLQWLEMLLLANYQVVPQEELGKVRGLRAHNFRESSDDEGSDSEKDTSAAEVRGRTIVKT